MEVTIRQRRLLFAGPWPDRVTSDFRSGCCSQEDSRGGGDPGPGQPAQHWQKSLRDDFKAFGALYGSTPTDRRTFGVDRLVWIDAARKEERVPWYTDVLLGAERFMASWHKSQEEASRLCEVNRGAKALLVNHNLLLDLPPHGASLRMNGFDLTACLELYLLLFLSCIFSVVASGAIRVARPPSHPKTWA